MEYIQNEKDKWEVSINKAIEILENSGLWQDVLENLKIAKSVGYEKLQEAHKVLFSDLLSDKEKEAIDLAVSFKNNNISLNEIDKIKENYNNVGIDWEMVKYFYNADLYELNENRAIEKIKEIDNRLIEVFNGKERYITEILFHFVKPLKIKKMYFVKGKANNEAKLNEIKQAIQNKKEIEVWGRAGYDVSFHYKPIENRAWYSEEFRGQGNGHYYIAISDKYALFMEDDWNMIKIECLRGW